MLGQQRNVGRTLAQGGQLDRDDVETPKEISAKAARGHVVLELAVGGCENAHVDALVDLVAHRSQDAVLDQTQQFGLHAQFHLADLVEQDGPAAGFGEAADAGGVGAGERASGVTEKLRLDQVGGDGGAVHRHERLLGSR